MYPSSTTGGSAHAPSDKDESAELTLGPPLELVLDDGDGSGSGSSWHELLLEPEESADEDADDEDDGADDEDEDEEDCDELLGRRS
jgi:hypothetical protein